MMQFSRENSLGRSGSGSAATASVRTAALLHRRARHRPVGAVHTAVARKRTQDRLALLALVEKLAGVRRHRLALGEAALRAGQD